MAATDPAREGLDPDDAPIHWLRDKNEQIANLYGRVLDNIWRDGGFVYEARLRGYTTADDLIRLVDEGTKKDTPEYRDLLDIKHSVDEHFGAFDRLTDFEKNVLGEVIFFYPWLRASAVWTAKLPIHHPVKAAFLEIGGSYSRERAREDFIELFMSEGGANRELAELGADKVMDFAPGIFLTEGGTAVDPRSISLASSPFEALQVANPLLQGDVDEFLTLAFEKGTPAVGVAGAALEGIWDPPWGDPIGDRLVDSVQSLNRDVTLARRLSGDQGSWFSFTPERAIGSRVGGSWFPKDVNAEAIVDQTREQYRDSLPADRRTYARFAETREKYRQLLIGAGLLDKGERNPEPLRESFNRAAQMVVARDAALKRAGQPAGEAWTLPATRAVAREEMRLLRDWKVVTPGQYSYAVRQINKLSKDEIMTARRRMSSAGNGWFRVAYMGPLSNVRRVLLEAVG